MGGYPPLGYDPKDRTLLVNEAEAEQVRQMFVLYLEFGTVNRLVTELHARGIVSKRWTSTTGVVRGGVPYSRGAIFHLLRNRIYLGEIVHKEKVHAGQHNGILDREIFEAAQARLDANKVTRRDRTTRKAPLAGLIFDAEGKRMTPAYARGRSGQRYHYYVCAALQTGGSVPENIVSRVPAPAIEDAIVERLRRWSGRMASSFAELAPHLRRIEVHRDAIILHVAPPAHEGWTSDLAPSERVISDDDDNLRITCTMKICTRGGRTWLIQSVAARRRACPDRALIAGLRRAHAELRLRGIDLADLRGDLAGATGMGDPYLRRLSTLAFLAPDIQRAILEGRQPTGLTLADLLTASLPLDWHAQRQMLGFVA